MVENFNGGNENIQKSSLETKKEQFSSDGNSAKNDTNTLTEELLNIKIEEKIDNEIGEFLSSISISQVDKEIIYKKLLGFSNNEELLNKILLDIKDSESISDVNSIIDDYVSKKGKAIDNQEKAIDNQEKAVYDKNLINLTNSFSNLDRGNKFYQEYLNKFDELRLMGFDKNEVKKLLNQLKSDDNAFNSLADDLQRKDPKQYENFKSSLIQIDSSFRGKFDEYEDGLLPAKQKIVLGVNNINGVNISNNTLVKKMDDGFEIEAGVDGRKLFVSGSEYKLYSKIGVKEDLQEIFEIEKEVKEEVSGLNKRLNSIQNLKNYVSESIINGVDVNDVKQNIKNANPDLYNELQLDLTTSLEQVIQGLDYLYNKIEKEKDGILKKIKQRVDEIVSRNAQEAKEKDKSKKETLKILHKIGFDLIPQSVSDYAINMLNSNNSLKLLGFQSDIDIENGNLGTNFDSEKNKISLKEIQKFTELMNIIISGSKDYPVVIDSLSAIGKPNYKSKDGTPITDDKLQIFISEQLGSNPNSRVKLNLEEYLENKDNKKEEKVGGVDWYSEKENS